MVVVFIAITWLWLVVWVSTRCTKPACVSLIKTTTYYIWIGPSLCSKDLYTVAFATPSFCGVVATMHCIWNRIDTRHTVDCRTLSWRSCNERSWKFVRESWLLNRCVRCSCCDIRYGLWFCFSSVFAWLAQFWSGADDVFSCETSHVFDWAVL